MPASPTASPLRYINAQTAQQIDDHLMDPSKGGFELAQLMELAGLACATALGKTFPLASEGGKFKNVLVCCGPGNQGGDGLVAARHLAHFGYEPTVYLPKPGKNPLYQALLKQVENLDIPVVSTLDEFKAALADTSCILDAIFGFSFHPPLRAPFDSILPLLASPSLTTPILSVDIPSGWDVSKGPIPLPPTDAPALQPYALISLTAPKEGVRFFQGEKHWLGGRFIPPRVTKEFGLEGLEEVWKGAGVAEQVVEIEARGETK